MKDFRTLKVWQKGHEFLLSLYRLTSAFPKEERYGLTSQIRRAGLSIPTNIAEGCGRGSDLDFARFLQIAMGSASEIEYLLMLSRDLQYLKSAQFEQLNASIAEIKRMLTSLIRKVRFNS